MENNQRRAQAYLTASLVATTRKWTHCNDETRISTIQALQDHFLEGNTSGTLIELKTGHVLVLQYDYPGMPSGFSLQIVYDEDREIRLGGCGAKQAFIANRGSIVRQINLDQGDMLDHQSSRIASFLND